MSGPAGSAADGTAADGDLHGRPTAAELVDAVLGYLKEDLLPRAEGPDRHQVRIAVRALEIVDRELRLGPDQARAHAERLASLGFETDGDLARAIRSGQVADSDALRRALTADTADRLRVANPGWLPDAGDATP